MMKVHIIIILICVVKIINAKINIERNVDGEFVFTQLRGSNYLRLANRSMPILFEPELYPTWDIENAIKEMNYYGYNYVRVFVDCPTLYHGFGMETPGVPMNFTMNIVDFLLKAAKYDIAVMLTAIWTPINYQSIIMSYPVPANVTGMKVVIFHAGQAAGKAQFFIDLLSEIKNMSQTAFDNIFAIDIFNEIQVSVHEQPYSLTSGLVTFVGRQFDMGKGADRQELLDVCGNIWFNTVCKAIKSVGPSILVSASVFSPNSVGHNGFDGVEPRPPNADPRYPLRPASLVNSLADYIDLHAYPGHNDTQAQFDGAALSRVKPLLLGETGAFKVPYPTAVLGAEVIKSVMIESLNYGFSGWGMWTWDTVEQVTLWTLTEANNTMNNILSPRVWPIVS